MPPATPPVLCTYAVVFLLLWLPSEIFLYTGLTAKFSAPSGNSDSGRVGPRLPIDKRPPRPVVVVLTMHARLLVFVLVRHAFICWYRGQASSGRAVLRAVDLVCIYLALRSVVPLLDPLTCWVVFTPAPFIIIASFQTLVYDALHGAEVLVAFTLVFCYHTEVQN